MLQPSGGVLLPRPPPQNDEPSPSRNNAQELSTLQAELHIQSRTRQLSEATLSSGRGIGSGSGCAGMRGDSARQQPADDPSLQLALRPAGAAPRPVSDWWEGPRGGESGPRGGGGAAGPGSRRTAEHDESLCALQRLLYTSLAVRGGGVGPAAYVFS